MMKYENYNTIAYVSLSYRFTMIRGSTWGTPPLSGPVASRDYVSPLNRYHPSGGIGC
jgi:hypothetical protein